MCCLVRLTLAHTYKWLWLYGLLFCSATPYAPKAILKKKKEKKKSENTQRRWRWECENACHVLACVFVRPKKKMISTQYHIEFNTIRTNGHGNAKTVHTSEIGIESERYERDSLISKRNKYMFINESHWALHIYIYRWIVDTKSARLWRGPKIYTYSVHTSHTHTYTFTHTLTMIITEMCNCMPNADVTKNFLCTTVVHHRRHRHHYHRMYELMNESFGKRSFHFRYNNIKKNCCGFLCFFEFLFFLFCFFLADIRSHIKYLMHAIPTDASNRKIDMYLQLHLHHLYTTDWHLGEMQCTLLDVCGGIWYLRADCLHIKKNTYNIQVNTSLT